MTSPAQNAGDQPQKKRKDEQLFPPEKNLQVIHRTQGIFGGFLIHRCSFRMLQ